MKYQYRIKAVHRRDGRVQYKVQWTVPFWPFWHDLYLCHWDDVRSAKEIIARERGSEVVKTEIIDE